MNETPTQETFLGKLAYTLSKLDLSPETEIEFKKAVIYIYHKLKAMLKYDHANTKLKGPLTIIKSGQKFDDTTTVKVNNSKHSFFPLNFLRLIFFHSNSFYFYRCVITLQFET